MKNKKKLQISILTSSILILSGCMENISIPKMTNIEIPRFFNSETVIIHSIKPAKVPIRSKNKVISVARFENDKYQLSNKIISVLNSTTVKGNKYFTVTNQFELDKKLKNLGFKDTGLIRKEEALKIKKAIGSENLILGNVSDLHISYRFFDEDEHFCDNKKGCYKRVIPCKTTNFDLSSYIRLVDLKTSEVLFSETLNKTKSYRFCENDPYKIPSNETIAQELSMEIAHEFVNNLTPIPYNFEVELLIKDKYFKFTKSQENKLNLAIANVKRGRYEKSLDLFIDLIIETKENSYVPLYNAGVMKEALGELYEAEKLYYRAEKLCPEPIGEILDAIVRIKKLEKERNLFNEDIQINNIKKTKEELEKLRIQAEKLRKYKQEQERLAKIKLEMEEKQRIEEEKLRIKKEAELREKAKIEEERLSKIKLEQKIKKEKSIKKETNSNKTKMKKENELKEKTKIEEEGLSKIKLEQKVKKEKSVKKETNLNKTKLKINNNKNIETDTEVEKLKKEIQELGTDDAEIQKLLQEIETLE